jgi:uncharacterized protein (TIGR03083 family)
MEVQRVRTAVTAAYDGITAVVADLSDADLLRPTRCRGWTVVDLLFHLVCDAQRALVALASPATGPADVDHVTYWAPFRPGADDGSAHAWWVRRSTGAFGRPAGVVTLWTDTAPAAARAGTRADPDGFVSTQGHVLAVPDFLATLATEAAVHHLDLVVDLPAAAGPDADVLSVAADTLDGILGAARPAGWGVETYLLKGTGRLPLGAADREALGAAADRFPLLG